MEFNRFLSRVNFQSQISFLYQGELHKHCAASHEVELSSYREYAAQIQPVKKPSNASQCGWEPFGKAFFSFLFHNNVLILVIRLSVSCYPSYVEGFRCIWEGYFFQCSH